MAADSCTHDPAYAPMPPFSARHNEHHHRMLPSTKAYHPRYAKMRPSSGARRKPSAVGERKPKETGKDLSFSLAYADLFRQEHHMLLRIHRSIAYAREDSSLTGPLLGCDSEFDSWLKATVRQRRKNKTKTISTDSVFYTTHCGMQPGDTRPRDHETRVPPFPTPPGPAIGCNPSHRSSSRLTATWAGPWGLGRAEPRQWPGRNRLKRSEPWGEARKSRSGWQRNRRKIRTERTNPGFLIPDCKESKSLKTTRVYGTGSAKPASVTLGPSTHSAVLVYTSHGQAKMPIYQTRGVHWQPAPSHLRLGIPPRSPTSG